MKSPTITLIDYLMRPLAFAAIVLLAIPLQQSCSREKKKKRTEEKIGDRDKGGVRYTHYPNAELLRNLAVTYTNYIHENSNTPKNWESLSELLGDDSESFIAECREKIVVVWDIDMEEYRKTPMLVAYVKEAPEKGGWVAFSDTTVRDVTADEFSELIKK